MDALGEARMKPAQLRRATPALAINPDFQWALWAFLAGFAVGLYLKFV
jgi:hypothetical protein